MLDNQIYALTTIIKDKDLRNYAGDAFWGLVQTVVTADPFAAMSTIKDIKEIVFHVPTILFWDKMKRYLFGTFYNFEEQVKMAEKFNYDNKEYNIFVKKQIHLINGLDDDMKIDYFASLTRCFLMTNLNQELFFKLAKFLSTCTVAELEFIKSKPMDFKSENTAMISILYQSGLFSQEEKENGGAKYVFSDFAKALKQNCLNFNEGIGAQERYCAYEQLEPLSIAEPATWEDIENAIGNNTLALDGGEI